MKIRHSLVLAIITLGCPVAAVAQNCDAVRPSFEIDTDRFKSAVIVGDESNPSEQLPIKSIVELEADISYIGSPLSHVEFEFDGERKRFVAGGEHLADKQNGNWDLAIDIGPKRSGADVEIQHGRVLLTVETVGTDGCTSVNKFSLVGGDSRVRAVVVGVSDYDYVQSLNHAAEDAREFEAFLKSYFEGKEKELKVDLFIEDDAKERDIMKRIEDIHETISEYGSFIFYFSGHGTIAKNSYGRLTPYLAVKDSEADKANTSMLDKQSIVSYYMGESSAKLNLYVIDSCLSGTPLPSSQASPVAGALNKRLQLSPRIAQELRDPETRRKIFNPPSEVIGFVSSGGAEPSYELDDLGGVYSHYLELSAEELDPDKTGSFDYKRLHDITKEKIRNSLVDQNPQFHALPVDISEYAWLDNQPVDDPME